MKIEFGYIYFSIHSKNEYGYEYPYSFFMHLQIQII